MRQNFGAYHSYKYQFFFSHFFGLSSLWVTFPNLDIKKVTDVIKQSFLQESH